MTKAIESGMAKLRIEESATKKQARIDSGSEVSAHTPARIRPMLSEA